MDHAKATHSRQDRLKLIKRRNGGSPPDPATGATLQNGPVTSIYGSINATTTPAARLSHPPRAEEHLIPLMVAAGAAGKGIGRRVFSDSVLETTVSAYRFD